MSITTLKELSILFLKERDGERHVFIYKRKDYLGHICKIPAHPSLTGKKIKKLRDRIQKLIVCEVGESERCLYLD